MKSEGPALDRASSSRADLHCGLSAWDSSPETSTMTRNANLKKRVRAYAEQYGLTYQQALQQFNPDGTPRTAPTAQPEIRSAKCMGPHDMLICPCEGCEPEKFDQWFKERAPRLARARAVGDPIYDFESDDLSDFFEALPEFAQLKAALSELAQSRLEDEWGYARGGEWPSGPEFVLMVRDEWRNLVLPLERDTLRAEISGMVNSTEYPLSGHMESGYEMDLDAPLTPADLEAEAEELEELAARVTAMAQMIRDHLRGRTTTAAEALN